MKRFGFISLIALLGIVSCKSPSGPSTDTFLLTLSSSGNGTASADPATGPYASGSEVTVTAVPDAGFRFANWTDASGSPASTENPYVFSITADTQLTANFQPITPVLTITAENGTVSANPDKTLYDYGEDVTLTAAPDTDYVFARWEGDLDGSENPVTFRITDDTDVTAVFVDENATMYDIDVTVNPTGAGSVNPGSGQFEEGETILFMAEANAGYAFENWNGDASSSDPAISIGPLAGDVSLTANFEELYRIDITQPTGGTISLDPDREWYSSGEEVVVSIAEEDGYRLTEWSGDARGSESTTTVTVGTSDLTVGAEVVERWLILIHFAVDNDIDYYMELNRGFVSDYLETLEDVEAADDLDVLDIVVLLDAYDATDPAGASYTSPFTDGYYALTGGDIEDDLAVDTGEINSGRVSTSEDFIDWAYENSSGRRVLYSVFNHGSGFDDPNITATYGIGFDDSANSDSLSHDELQQVTEYLSDAAGGNIDLFYPYACLMGGLELAWEVRNDVDTLLFSEESFPADYWSYEALEELVSDPEMDAEELAEAFCDSARDYFTAPAIDRPFTLAAVDLAEIDPVYDSVDDLADALLAWMSADDDRPALLNEAAAASLFMSTPYYTDLGVFLDRLDTPPLEGEFESETDDVRDALDDFVVRKETFAGSGSPYEIDLDDACGVSIFHNIWLAQGIGKGYHPETYQNILDFGATNGWAAYMEEMYEATNLDGYGPGEDYYEPDSLSDTGRLGDFGISEYHTFHAEDSDGDGVFEPDQDVIIFELTAGESYRFETTEVTTPCDTVMILYYLDGNTLVPVMNNDDKDGPNGDYSSMIEYTSPINGYFVVLILDYYLTLTDYNFLASEGAVFSYESPAPPMRKYSVPGFELGDDLHLQY